LAAELLAAELLAAEVDGIEVEGTEVLNAGAFETNGSSFDKTPPDTPPDVGSTGSPRGDPAEAFRRPSQNRHKTAAIKAWKTKPVIQSAASQPSQGAASEFSTTPTATTPAAESGSDHAIDQLIPANRPANQRRPPEKTSLGKLQEASPRTAEPTANASGGG